LIVAEHHLSATILTFLIGVVLMYVGGAPPKIFVIAASLAGLLILALVLFPEQILQLFRSLPDYMSGRIIAWLDKDYSPLDARWQTNQSLYAIGSGGMLGSGIGNSRQKYMYVSEPQNDFVFAIVCEELGFIGAALIIALFILFVWRGFIIAMRAPDRFGTLLTIGLVFQVGLQAALNIAVVTDTIPNTGISLPFFSYGGTALMMLLFEMGVVLSVSRATSFRKVQAYA
jgi:cell division protein FtsW